MELAQIYEDKVDINNAIENYKNSFTMWEKILKDITDYEIYITLTFKLAELYNKAQNYHDACEILKYVSIFLSFIINQTENKYSEYFNDKKKMQIKFKQLIITNSFANRDIVMYLEELISIEVFIQYRAIYMQKVYYEYYGVYHKNIAKNCVSIGFAYLEMNKRRESFEYFEKAERVFTMCGNLKAAKEVQLKKQEIFNTQ